MCKGAKTPGEALDELNSGCKPDLIITDINVPVMDGMTFIKEIHKITGYKGVNFCSF
ncbi:hypothetical protein KFV02_08185 [Desulfohalobiaceae bacterium Ax17]|nr:hypothetical protein [Desulfovulcanus ferrireducens]